MKTNSVPQATSDFFVVGGTLPLNAPSYVSRPADDALFNLALAGEFCYVLTTRQMGKSSLMVRAARRLQDKGVRTAIVDLTTIGTGTGTWYLDLLTELTNQLNLSEDTEAWWQTRASLGVVRRFTDFLRDVILVEIKDQIAIFIDEIDITLNLPFADDFFAAVRAVYNARAVDSRFNRLTFVFLGVASPSDLIKDRTRTPFNIGQGIALADFNRADAAVLQKGLAVAYPGQAQAILNRIYYWTDGQPYLTQRLCREIVEAKGDRWTHKEIDQFVERLFFLEQAQRDTNLIFVQDKVLMHAHRRQLLTLYRKVYQGKRIRNDEQLPLQNQLKLSGLVKSENGYLHVHNRIYRYVFDLKWIRANTAVDWSRIVAGIAVFVALLAVGVVLYNRGLGDQVEKCTDYFFFDNTPVRTANTPVPTADTLHQKRLACLVRTFGSQGILVSTDYAPKAIGWFYSLSRQDQLALFHDAQNADDLVTVVEGLYQTLADVDNTGSTNPLLQEMATALGNLNETRGISLTQEINNWNRGRELAKPESYDEALLAYNTAVPLNDKNPATLYERAGVRINLLTPQYSQALNDLDQIVANLGPVTPTPSATPATPNVTATASPVSTPSAPTPGTGAPPATVPPGSVTAPSTTPSSIVMSTPMPTSTPTPTPTPLPFSFESKFKDHGDIMNAVRNLISSNPKLVSFLLSAPSSEYPNLRKFGLVPPDACSPEFESLLPAGRTLVSKTPLSITDDFQCVMLYRLDLPKDGRKTAPVGGMVYRTDRNRPADIYTYPLTLPGGIYLGQHQVTALITDVLSGAESPELVIKDTDEDGIVVEISIFSYRIPTQSEDNAYELRGWFVGDGGVIIDANKVTVLTRRQGTRSQLADRRIFLPRDNKSYYKNDTMELVDPEQPSPCLVSLAMPQDPAMAEYSEKPVLAFYERLMLPDTNRFNGLMSSEMQKSLSDPGVSGCLMDAQTNNVCVRDVDIGKAPGIPPHIKNENGVITDTVIVTSTCMQSLNGKLTPKDSVITWPVRWIRDMPANPGRWELLKPVAKP